MPGSALSRRRTTPGPATSALDGLLITALKEEAVKEKLGMQGLYPNGTYGADFAAYLKKQHDEYRRIIAEANIKAE
jgi:tripartite-type tricarboxylate transporter receptor subunit TctC